MKAIGIPFCGKHSRSQPFQLSHETSSCGLSKTEITSISLLPFIPLGFFFYRTIFSKDLHHLLNWLQRQLQRPDSEIHCRQDHVDHSGRMTNHGRIYYDSRGNGATEKRSPNANMHTKFVKYFLKLSQRQSCSSPVPMNANLLTPSLL